jgi:mono/diheme cytochrome c family protein
MSQSEDRNFIRQFSGIIIGLVLLTIILIFLARSLQFEPDVDANPSQKALAEQRISPVSGVRTGDEGVAALAEAQAAATPAPAQNAVAEVGGEQVYNRLCMTCHAAGVAGAPITGSDQMAHISIAGLRSHCPRYNHPP